MVDGGWWDEGDEDAGAVGDNEVSIVVADGQESRQSIKLVMGVWWWSLLI